MPLMRKHSRYFVIQNTVSVLWLLGVFLLHLQQGDFRKEAPSIEWPQVRTLAIRPDHQYPTIDAVHTCLFSNKTIVVPEAPSFVIIGAQKSGTTAVAQYLVVHPNVRDTKKAGREPHFLDNAFQGMKDWLKEGKYTSMDEFFCHARERYANLFFNTEQLLEAAHNGTRLMTFDKSPSYIHLPDAAYNLRRICPWLNKVVVILRNPVDRAFSHYQMNLVDRTNKRTWGTFEHHVNQELEQMHRIGLIGKSDLSQISPNFTTISPHEEAKRFTKLSGPSLLRKGMYSIQLLEWLENYPDPDMLLVLNFDDLERDARETYHRILRHVGLPEYDLPDGYRPLYRGSYESMRNNTRQFLERFFAPYNRRLAKLLGQDWRGVWGSDNV